MHHAAGLTKGYFYQGKESERGEGRDWPLETGAAKEKKGRERGRERGGGQDRLL